jgi:hypothetical protein
MSTEFFVERRGYLTVTRPLEEGRLAYADLGYSGNKKIKFSGVDAGEAIAPAAVKAFKKYLVGLGIKPAMAKKLADYNAHHISHALAMISYEDLG